MKSWRLWLPLGLFLLLVAVLLMRLANPGSDIVESQMVGEPLPEFALEPAAEGVEGLSDADFRTGEPHLLNIFASWCLPCIAEAPHLKTLADEGATIHAVAIRDTPEDVGRFLARHGNPYDRVGADPQSALMIDLGASGVPETFVVDGEGTIVHQHIGDVRAEDVPKLLAELEKAR